MSHTLHLALNTTAEKALRARVKQIHLHFFLWQPELAGEIAGRVAWNLATVPSTGDKCQDWNTWGSRSWLESAEEAVKGFILSRTGFRYHCFIFTCLFHYACFFIKGLTQEACMFQSKGNFRVVGARSYLTQTTTVHMLNAASAIRDHKEEEKGRCDPLTKRLGSSPAYQTINTRNIITKSTFIAGDKSNWGFSSKMCFLTQSPQTFAISA